MSGSKPARTSTGHCANTSREVFLRMSMMAGHCSDLHLFKTLLCTWWWKGLYKDVMAHSNSCPPIMCLQQGTGMIQQRPPLEPGPVQRPFQIWGVGIIELPNTSKGSSMPLGSKTSLPSGPLCFQRQTRRVWAPEALLSDQGANLLSHQWTCMPR